MATVTATDQTQVITSLPFEVKEHEHIWIPLADGTRLAARLWLPQVDKPVPVILEYLPYRKRDGTAMRDALTHPYFAGHGYACVRVDIRGFGESEGLTDDEYSEQEQRDGLAVIDWLTQQPWCNGKVGMMGISWGGFNSLQLAYHQPAALKAILTLCSTDDRYADDIHYHGGCLLSENIGWAGVMQSYTAYAPDPALVGDTWKAQWLARLEQMPDYAQTWLEHSHRDAYWQQGSICEDYARITTPVYAVGGWGDAYHRCILRMMEHLSCPKKALIGPWAHKYPHFATPNPNIGFLQEALRWWDYWLKDIDNGIMDESAITLYQQDAVPPQSAYAYRSGYWLRENAWPSPNVHTHTRYLSRHGLTTKAESSSTPVSWHSQQTTGSACGEYCVIWLGPESPTDQREDDSHSLTFDTETLAEDCVLLGAPKLVVPIACDKPVGKIAVRLNHIAPDGASTRISYGVLNLCMRNGMETPEYLVPDQYYRCTVELDACSYIVPAGHKLRLALSDAYFPLIWPSPETTRIQLQLSGSVLSLPIHNQQTRLLESPFLAPESTAPMLFEEEKAGRSERSVHKDVASGALTTDIMDDFGTTYYPSIDLSVMQRCDEKYRILPNDPTSAQAHIRWQHCVRRGDWSYSVQSSTQLRCDAQFFYLVTEQTAFINHEQVHYKKKETVIDRQYQ